MARRARPSSARSIPCTAISSTTACWRLSPLAATSPRKPQPQCSPRRAVVDSDFEAASFLLELVKRQSIEGQPARAVLPRDRYDQFVLRTRPRAAGCCANVRTRRLKRSSQFSALPLGWAAASRPRTYCMTVASNHAIEGPARDAYITAAEKLGDFEQGRTLSALVKSERRK